MAITSVAYTQSGPGTFVFTYASNLADPTFYIWVNGDLVAETLETSYEVSVPIGDQLQFDVFDDPDDEPTDYYPTRLTLRWEGRDGANTYRVDQYTGGQWVAKSIHPHRVSNLYHYVTGVLDDVTTYQFRVVPIDAEGRSGTALSFTAEMVRYPDEPAQTMTFTAGELVIT